MKRNKKIAVLAHCLLNVNAKVAGLALYEGVHREVVLPLIQSGVGIIQLPCPETSYLGLQRWGMSKNQYDTPFYRAHCRTLLIPTVEQIQEYLANGYEIEAVFGVDGSPSCGVQYHGFGYRGGMIDGAEAQKTLLHEASGSGVYFDELKRLLAEKGLQIKLCSVSEKKPLGD